ncbi:MAG TPA: AMP-binding protein, partial [Pseudomonadales bacterium]|nr:AMP-binding protein [Pseudomonadales bacterium]
MTYPVIVKPVELIAHANMKEYDTERRNFSWERALSHLSDLGEGKINIAYEALDRHLGTPIETHTAIRFLAKDSEQAQDISYAELAAQTNRFANLLKQLGLQPGDKVFCLSSRIPDLYIAALGCLKHGCVFSPLFSAFGPEPIRARMEIGKPVAVITTEKLFAKKMADWIGQLPFLKHVLLIGNVEHCPDTAIPVRQRLTECSADYKTQPMDPEAMALLHFT